jgi:hypothetical protein
MARKQQKSKASARKSRTRRSASNSSIQVRMYRQGLGDCFLITIPREKGDPFYIMIDCGVVLGTPNAAARMNEVLNDIVSTTTGHIHLLVVTHQHWDHLSGFLQARSLFETLKIDSIWLAWTENPNDALAKKLKEENRRLQLALASGCARMHLDGGTDSTLDNLMEFLGAPGQGTTEQALEVIKKRCDQPRFCLPTDSPVQLEGTDVRLYVLGPPHDENLIKRINPSQTHPETYGLTAMLLDKLAPVITNPDHDAPFDRIAEIPFVVAQQMPFFQTYYWGEVSESPVQRGEAAATAESDQSWRRIDGEWLNAASAFALQLDSATNNTSLVLAIELGTSEVLLFTADAQVGNWLSWQDLSWEANGKKITGPDLLNRTVLYKVGHHGSHNGTLRDNGLELMTNLKLALIPVDHEMAVKKQWVNMPLDGLEQRLNQITKGRVLRVDKDIPAALVGQVTENKSKLYYEVVV